MALTATAAVTALPLLHWVEAVEVDFAAVPFAVAIVVFVVFDRQCY